MIPTSGASKFWILLTARFCPNVVLSLGVNNNFALSPGHLGCRIRLELDESSILAVSYPV